MIGQTLGHYSIVEKIGAGGMGVVYRAHDEQLGRDIALKVLPAGTLDDEAARKQFRKEAMALARLNHPNIATVFEFSSQDNVDFLAMELIPGIPLNQKIKSGPLSEKEALRIASQLAEGLAAAHEQGVIHRDLKPANLFITPDGRLKILDFGLAKFVHPDPANAATATVSTDTGSISGTLPYMSPEQLRGMPVDARSDIYAAGAVLYEMATAQRPFPQTQGAVLTGAILHETPPFPQSLNSRVSVAISNVIMKALEKEPTQRYQSARELRVALEGLTSSAHHVLAEPATGRKTLMTGRAAALGVVLLAGLAIGFNLGGLRERFFSPAKTNLSDVTSSNMPVGPVHMRRSVAVLGFKNLSQRGEAGWISPALAEMLTAELRAGEKLRIVSGEQIALVKVNLALPDSDSFGKETLGKIRQNIGSDAIILGSYLASGNGQVRVDMHLQDAHTGETLASVTESGPEGQISDIVSRAGVKLRATLGAGAVSSAEASSLKLSMPSNATAMRFYSEGVERLHNLDAAEARDLLLKAIAADPKFALSYTALTQAWRDLGREKDARNSIKKALELSAGLPTNDRLLIEANYHLVYHEWQKAREAYERLFRAAPDRLEYGLAYTSAQTKSGDLKGAYATAEALRKLPSPIGENPRIDMVEAENAATEGDAKRVLAKYEAAAVKARATGARLILANSLNRQAFALASSGQIDRGIAASEEARAIYESVKDPSGVAASKYTLATMLFQRGDLQDVEKLLKEIVAYGDKTGDKSYAVISLTVLAQTQVRQARLPEARKNYERVLAAARDQDDKYNEQFALTGIADTLFDMGDRAAAKQYYEQSIALTKITGDKGNAAAAQLGLSDILRTQGDVDGAMKLLQQAMAAYEELGLKVQAAQTLNAIAGMKYDSGDSETAEKDWMKVREICQEAQIRSCAAKATLSIAESLNNKGKNSEAAGQYQRAIEVYREMDEKGNLSLALASLAQVKIDVGDLGSAGKFEDEAVAMARTSGNKDILANALRVRGSLLVSQGKLGEAQKNFEQSLGIFKSLNMKEQVARGRRALGNLRESRDELAAAQDELREANSIYREIKATREIQSVQLSLANIELTQRRPERAIGIAKAVLDEFVKAKSKEGEGAAHLVLAKALIAHGKPAEAQSELEAALTRIYAEESLLAKTDLAITAAEVKAATGKPEEGIPTLEIALSDATSRGYVPVQYKVRLALGLIEMKAGRIASARTRLSTLQKDASAKGFLLIARRAKEAGEGRAAN